MAIIPRGAGGSSGGGSVALSDATPAALGTASPGVSTEASRADHVHEAPSGGVDTSLQAAPDTGWTAAGNGTASSTGGVATLAVSAAQASAVLRRTHDLCSPHLPALEMVARVTVTTVPASGSYYVGIGVINDDIPSNGSTARGAIAQAQSDGSTYLFVNGSGSWSFPGSAASPATLTGGSLWLRIVYSAGGVAILAGSGATLPSSWTTVAAVAPQHLLSGPGLVRNLLVFAGRGGGTGDLEVEVSDIQWRSLLGAPV